MSRLRWIPIALAGAGCLALALYVLVGDRAAVPWRASASAARAQAPPGAKNVLLITLDALRFDHLSLSGYPRQTSPHLDALAARGLVFETIVPSGCSTKTSLSSLFTSLDFNSHRILEHEVSLPAELPTLAEAFRRAGWSTEGFVATPHLAAELGYDRGFDVYHDFTETEGDYVSADTVVLRVISRLEARASSGRAERPFFYYVHIEEPHPPWRHGSPWASSDDPPMERPFDEGCTHVPSAEELAEFSANDRQRMIDAYDGAIHFADRWIGRLLSTLRENGDAGDSVIAVSTDHGLELVERYSATHGMNGFDEVVRTFLILATGAPPDPNAPTHRQGRIFDIGPTVAARAGIEATLPGDGVDLLGDESPPPFAFTKCYSGTSVRGEGYKLIRPDYANRRWKKRSRPVGLGERPLLFDLEADPEERHDLAEAEPEELQRLLAALARYQEKLGGQPEGLPRPSFGSTVADRLRALGYLE